MKRRERETDNNTREREQREERQSRAVTANTSLSPILGVSPHLHIYHKKLNTRFLHICKYESGIVVHRFVLEYSGNSINVFCL